MGTRNNALLAVSGGLAGLVTWLVSEPFVRSIPRTHYYSFGTFYGWFAHLLFGVLTASALAFTISRSRTGVPKALIAGAIAAATGGLLVCLTDAVSDLFWLQVGNGSLWMRRPGFTGAISWSLAVALALALSVAIATQPTHARIKRAIWAGLAAGIVAFFFRSIFAQFEAIVLIASINMNDLANGKSALANWSPFAPARLFNFMSMGITVGLVLGFGESAMRRAWMRVMVGTNETRDYPLDDHFNRIGSSEGLEVSLFGDRSIIPIHATVDRETGSFILTDRGSKVGTLVNGKPVHSEPLKDGDEIRIGNTSMQFRTPKVREYYDPLRPFGYVPLDDPNPAPPAQHRLIDPFGNVISLPVGIAIIGRDPAATVNVSYDPKVSRAHAQIESDSIRALISDRGSGNGTFVNGAAAPDRTTLNDGDRIQVGDTQFTYRR